MSYDLTSRNGYVKEGLNQGLYLSFDVALYGLQVLSNSKIAFLTSCALFLVSKPSEARHMPTYRR